MKPPKFYVGVDISKLTADITVLAKNELILQTQAKNNELELRDFFKNIRTEFKCCKENTCICVENMGIYNTFLCNATKSKRFRLYMGSPLDIKRSLGLQRGKNDAIDALRIATYASMHFASLQQWEPPRPAVERLKALSRIRNRLIKAKVLLKNPDKLERFYFTKTTNSKLKKYMESTIKSIGKDVKQLEIEMDNIVESDQKLKRIMGLIVSVPRIGKIIAREIIIHTNEFKYFNTPRAFACYCGIVPFEWKSGSDVKGKARISRIGNRDLKALLHIASMGIIKDKRTFLYDFYLRKVNEGKNKMSVLNALRNKLVHRIFACVRDNKMFVEIPYEKDKVKTDTSIVVSRG